MVKTTNSIQLRTVSKFFGEFVKSHKQIHDGGFACTHVTRKDKGLTGAPLG
jgi:hypothetical protein